MHAALCYGVYGLLTILQLLFTALAYALAPVVALFCRDDGYLPNWLSWFQTQDAPLDAGVRDGYPGYSATDSKWWNRTKWLWRNPAYGFCYWPLGIPYVPTDWIIKTINMSPAGVLREFHAVTRDGRYFSYTNTNGVKLGYKLWWALGPDGQLLPTMQPQHPPEDRLPLCFTP